MQIESVLQTKNRSEPAKNRFSVALLGTHVDSRQMYCAYPNQAAAAYSSLYFFSSLSLQFSKIQIFCCTFLRNCEAYKVGT